MCFCTIYFLPGQLIFIFFCTETASSKLTRRDSNRWTSNSWPLRGRTIKSCHGLVKTVLWIQTRRLINWISSRKLGSICRSQNMQSCQITLQHICVGLVLLFPWIIKIYFLHATTLLLSNGKVLRIQESSIKGAVHLSLFQDHKEGFAKEVDSCPYRQGKRISVVFFFKMAEAWHEKTFMQ